MFQRAPSRITVLALPALVGVATTVVLIGRLCAGGNPFVHIWAEDGKVFMAGSGSLSSFTQTYAGYAHTLPRLLAAIGGLLPMRFWAAYTVLAAVLVVGVLGAFVFAAARELTGSLVTAAVAAAALSLTPALMLETLGSLANLQWYLLPAVLWALFLPPRTMQLPASILTAVTAATTPLAVLLLPAVLVVHRRDVLRLWSVRALLAGEVLQGALIRFGTHAPDGPSRGMHRPSDPLGWFVAYAGGTGATRTLVWAALAAATLIVLVGLASAGPFRVHMLAAVGTAVLFLGVTTYVSGFVPSRYVACGCMIALAGVAIGIGSSFWALPASGVIVAVAVVGFTAPSYRFSGPTWQKGVAAWSATCATTTDRQAAIPVSPAGWGEAVVACPGRA